MKPELNIFGIEIPTFGLMISIGVLCFVIYILNMFRRKGITEDKIDTLIIICAIAGGMFAGGAALFDALWHNISHFKETGEFVWEWYGITFSGGLLSAAITFFIAHYIIMKKDRDKILFHLDIVVIGLCIAHAFGRIGCFFGGCCFGKIVEPNTFLSIYYPVFENGVEWAWVLPTQLYESAFLFILAAVLFFFVKKNRSAWYFIGYSIFRFLLEFLRGDDRGASPFGNLSPSQFLSIVMLIGGLILLLWREPIDNFLKSKNKKTEDDESTIDSNITVKKTFKEILVLYKKQFLLFFIFIILITTSILFTIGDGNDGFNSIKSIKRQVKQNETLYLLDNQNIYGTINEEGYLEYNLETTFNEKTLNYTYIPEKGIIESSWDIYTYDGEITYSYKKNIFSVLTNKDAKYSITYDKNIYINVEEDRILFKGTTAFEDFAKTGYPTYIEDITAFITLNMATNTTSSTLLVFGIIILLEIVGTIIFYFYTKKSNIQINN